MKLVSWNVNGIRASVRKGFYDILDKLDTDVIVLQETKAQDDQVAEALKDLDGYEFFSNSAVKKGYSGTAIISRIPFESTSVDMGMEEHDQEGRITRAEFDEFNLVNVYVPNSGSGLKRLDYRAEWDKAFTAYLAGLMEEKPLIVTGDFNVAHEAIDLARPKDNYNKTSGYTQKEIDGFNNMLAIGLMDSYRELYPEKIQYTFWNQRFRARDRNVGWRIDYFLVSENFFDVVEDSTIRDDVFGSDHCPIELHLNE
ncbi:MAG: exodeoxyribonuclease III [Bacteroidetes bacterium]|nr:exodeoxyribonuclease III [Bacteroidota bacterium]